VLIGSRLVDALDAGLTSAAATSATIPSPVAGDSGYLCVVADDLGEVAEPREGNNTASAAVTFIISDLTVSAITAPSTAAPGQRIAVSNSVANLGPLRTPHGFWVGIYYSADANCDTRDVQIGSRFVAGLDAGLSSADETTVYIPPDAATGTRFVCAVADTGGQVPETDENNNTASTAITVALPTVNLKVNGQDAVLPAAVSSNGPVSLTVDMTAGGKPLDHYLGIYVGGTLLWVTSSGVSTTPAPLARFTPVATTDVRILDVPRWPPGATVFLWLMLDGPIVVGQDLIRVNVSP
jgi:hypothetical protein